nr:MAG TPA: hypothetical protein [Caudoviricetes sp.]
MIVSSTPPSLHTWLNNRLHPFFLNSNVGIF